MNTIIIYGLTLYYSILLNIFVESSSHFGRLLMISQVNTHVGADALFLSFQSVWIISFLYFIVLVRTSVKCWIEVTRNSVFALFSILERNQSIFHHYIWYSVQLLSRVWLFAIPWTAACQASLSITNSGSLLKITSIMLVSPSYHLILCHPLLLLPSIVSSIRVFSNESVLCIRWPKYWSFSFSISPPNEYSGFISFRIDRFDLLAVQGTLKSLLQHHSSKASILWCSAFLMVQLSHPYMTTGKSTALTRWVLVTKVMSLLFNMLSMLVITFLPRSKCLLISWLQSPSAVIWSPRK